MRIVRSRIGRLSAAVGVVCLATFATARAMTPPTVPPTGSPGSSHPNEAATKPSEEALFEASIERRAAKTVGEMKLDDAAKAERVKERFKRHFRDLHAWDVAHGKERTELFKALRKDKENAELRAKYDALIAPLMATQKSFFDEMNAELTPEQVDAIRENLVGGRYDHNIRGYKAEYPDLPPEAWQKVVAMWQQAREEAMPLDNKEAKNEVFEIYKGRVNNWLSQQGYTGKSAAAKKARAASQPAAQ